MYPAYVWKHNSNPEKQVILLMVPNEEGRLMKKFSCSKKTISIIKRNKV